MDNLVPTVVFLSFLIRSVRNTLYHIFLWQLKEYRVDRMITHLKTPQGKRLMFGPLTLIKWLPLVVLISVALTNLRYLENISSVSMSAYYLFWIVLIVEASLNIKELISRGWRLPILTPKVLFILFVVFLAHILVLAQFLQYEPLLNLAPIVAILSPVFDKLLAPSIAFLVILFSIPAYIYRKWILEKAKRKIEEIREIRVIGVTGSYGKTSTKEFLATILAEKYNVAKTPASQGTDIGIARYILSELTKEHEVFVVEMGAYKRGEIREMCEIVHPKVGMITGINEQHLELFGSMENTMRAKFELIESLPKDGLAVFNADNPRCREMAKWAQGKELRIMNYELGELESVKVHSQRVDFVYRKKKLSAHVLGEHFLGNILGALKIAEHLGLTLEQITNGVTKITPPDKTMKPYPGPNGSILIDDTFNANPDGVLATLEYLKVYKGKKILVMAPMIELGDNAGKLHEKVGEKAAGVCDLVILTNREYYDDFQRGHNRVGGLGDLKILSGNQAVKKLKSILTKGDVAIFESKETKKILESLYV